MRYRVVLAFAVAPLASVAALFVLMALFGQLREFHFAFFAIALWYAYTVAGLLGVPAYFLTSSRNLYPPFGHSLIGALIGLLPALLLNRFTIHKSFLIEIVVSSAIAGLVFGLIAGRNLTIVGGVRDA